MWRATVLTLFPDIFPGPLDASILGRARAEERWSLDTIDIRTFSDNAYGSIDAPPYGGGAGLVMRVDILAAAIDRARSDPSRNDGPVICLSPRGAPLKQARVRRLADGPGLIAICGRFEGIDERIFAARNVEEVSIGDFVLAGGEIAAMAMIEACVRLVPGVLGSAQSLSEESFSLRNDARDGAIAEDRPLLEYPQYAQPRDFEGHTVPSVLLSGDHKKIADWRRHKAEEITRARRPDLLSEAPGPIRRHKDKDRER